METLKTLFLIGSLAALCATAQPLRVGIAGLVHGHAGGFLSRNLARAAELDLVGISEPDHDVGARYIKQYRLDASRVFASHAEMMDKTKPEAVMVFSSTYDHKEIVELCAARRIPVMMEKPLAVNMEHARAMEAAAKRGGIAVMVNYETTWYPVHVPIDRRLKDLGEIRRIVTHYGHQGPKEIGVQPEFFAWLTDPVKNGAGALFDFGCYGANFATWLFRNERPLSVLAVTRTNKPELYPRVDDEATIIVQYPRTQLIIQPSWNWPYSRKDMEIYGVNGYLITSDPRQYRERIGKQALVEKTAGPLAEPEDDVVRYLTAVARKRMQPAPHAFSSLENNLIVTEILTAARESARMGKAVSLPRAK